jgi:glutamine synthetase
MDKKGWRVRSEKFAWPKLAVQDFAQKWSSDQHAKVQEIDALIAVGMIDTVRFAFADQHGLVRGKTVLAPHVLGFLRRGISMVSTVLLKDTSHHTIYPVFQQNAGMGQSSAAAHFTGAGDVLLAPDPMTFCLLPWAPKTAWILCNAVCADENGAAQAAPFCTRSLFQRSLTVLNTQGYEFVAGLEVEFYLFKLADAKLGVTDAGWPGSPPQVTLLNTGYQLLTEQRIDQLHEPLELLRKDLVAMGLPLSSMEIELGPSQVEFVFEPQSGIKAADAMILFRNATKQIMRRHGYHASFMCRPRIPEVMSSGWHLHQSLQSIADGSNAFSQSDDESTSLSEHGMHYLAGLLAHARPATVFSTPTINGYRRYRANSLAPARVSWGVDNRGTMLRVVGQASAARIENRIGEPAANPYLYFASQVFSGLDGMARKLEAPASADYSLDGANGVYDHGEALPTSLYEALTALENDDYLGLAFGKTFVDYYVALKRFELARFESEVSEWEQREYFDLF